MKRALIIDDDAIRVPTLTRYAESLLGTCEVEHYPMFMANWDDFDLVLLDHDLGEGGDVSRHVSEAFPEGYGGKAWIIVHSMNPVGARNIVHTLNAGRVMPYSAILSRFSQ